jgi:hypothetical protein
MLPFWRFTSLLIGCVVLALLAVPAEAAGKRVALVIGNSGYEHAGELVNPKNDAADIAAALEKVGFVVISGIDLDKRGMENAIRRFAREMTGAEAGAFFYAGHGLQVAGQNYLVPTDAKLDDSAGVDFELIRLDLVQGTMEGAAKTNILFLDACRDNPLARNLARAMGTRSAAIGKGLASVESGIGTLISFSTQPGNVALDGKGRNSPFAGALAQQLLAGRGDLADMLISVRRSVMQATDNRQVPWEHSSLTDRFYFTAPSGTAAGPALSYAEQAELAFWESVRDSKQPSVVRSYIDAYPKGAFVVLAKAIIEQLEQGAGAGSAGAKSGEAASKAASLAPAGAAFDGEWRVVRESQTCRDKRSEFVIYVGDGQIRTNRNSGQVEADGTIEFKRESKETDGSFSVHTGRLVGSSGNGEFKGGWDGSRFKCGGQVTLTRLDDRSGAVDAASAPSRAADDPKLLAESLQRELQRVGCYAGTIDGEWGKQAEAALKEFAARALLALYLDEPTQAALDAVKSQRVRVCTSSATATAPSSSGGAARTVQGSGSNCRVESRDACIARMRALGKARPGACAPENRLVSC